MAYSSSVRELTPRMTSLPGPSPSGSTQITLSPAAVGSLPFGAAVQRRVLPVS